MKNYLEPILRAASDTLSEVKYVLKTPSRFTEFMELHGWIPGGITNVEAAAVSAAVNIGTLVKDVRRIVDDIKNNSGDVENLVSDCITALKTIYTTLNSINTIAAGGFSIFPLNQSVFWTELAEQLFPHYLARYLRNKQKTLYAIFRLFGVIEYQKITPGTTGRMPYYKTVINWDKLGDILGNPSDAIKTRYSWGSGSGLNHTLLLDTLQDVFDNMGIDTKAIPVTDSNYQNYYAANAAMAGTDIRQLDIPLLESWNLKGNNLKNLVLEVVPVPAGNGSSHVDGIALNPILQGFADFRLPITPELFLQGEGYFAADNVLNVKIVPGSVSMTVNSGVTTEVGIRFVAIPNQPYLLLGKRNGTRLEVSGFEVCLKFVNVTSPDPEVVFELGMGKYVNKEYIHFAYEPSEGDGFIQKILGKKPFSSTFGLGVRWSSKNGISFTGSGGFEIEIPLHDEKKGEESDKPLRIDTLRLGVALGSGKFKINAAVDISFELGFVAGSVTDIGASLSLTKRNTGESRGLLNNLDFDFGFKPPKGIGISVKAAAFEGGGYLYLDSDKGKYYGAIEIKIAKKFGLTAIGIVTTKNPDGTPGFSMLVLINVTFSPSIPIGFGFSLSGVGGMAGINRTLATEPLRQGVKTGAINHILFPENVIENIQTIVTDLDQIFPTQKGRYTFGLFFLLGWGVPTPLIKIKLGVIIEVPSPVKLAIIGTISLKLPSEEKAVLQLNVAFAGIIDFDKKYLTFDASIYDSKILTFSLYGDMAVRVFWGEHREILISVGGFHPAYSPPAYLLLPAKMDRLTISIFNESNLKLQLATYFAVTSNTVQFGARLDFLFKVSKFQVVGLFGFDVLFQFNPFKFRTDVYAMLAVKWGSRELMSLSLDFMLEGPGPWHAKGNASFKVLFIKCKVNFDKTWGPQPATTLPDVAVIPLITADLQKKENWLATLPDQKKLLVTIKELPDNDIVLHPLGTLSITQKIAPLGVKIERFGNQKPSDGGTYDISAVKIQSVTQSTESVTDNFAPAQFRNMDDNQKLKAASFEYLRAGVKLKSLTTSDLYMDAYATKEVEYERILIDNVHYDKQRRSMKRALVNGFIKGGLVSANAIAKQLRSDMNKPVVKASMVTENYQIISKDSLKELSAIPGSGIASTKTASEADVLTLMEKLVQQQPALAGKIQAVPVY